MKKIFTKYNVDDYETPKTLDDVIKLANKIDKEYFGNIHDKYNFEFKKFNLPNSYSACERSYVTKDSNRKPIKVKVVDILFNETLLDKNKEYIIDTIFHELLHAYIDIYYPDKTYESAKHIGIFLELGYQLGLQNLNEYSVSDKNYNNGYYVVKNINNEKIYFKSKNKSKLERFFNKFSDVYRLKLEDGYELDNNINVAVPTTRLGCGCNTWEMVRKTTVTDEKALKKLINEYGVIVCDDILKLHGLVN